MTKKVSFRRRLLRRLGIGALVAAQLAAGVAPVHAQLPGMGDGGEMTAAAGFDHHLVKPVDIEQLQAILATVRRR